MDADEPGPWGFYDEMPRGYRAATPAIYSVATAVLIVALVALYLFGLPSTTAIQIALVSAFAALLLILEMRSLFRGMRDRAILAAETPDARRARLETAAREMHALRFCHRVLSERIAAGGNEAWAWEHKDKIAAQMEALLADALPAEVRGSAPPLSTDDEARLLAAHPLLQALPSLRPGRLLRTRPWSAIVDGSGGCWARPPTRAPIALNVDPPQDEAIHA